MLYGEGVGKVSIVRIARDLGVTSGSFYWHFKDRNDLLQSLLDFWVRSHTEAIIQEIDTPTDFEFLHKTLSESLSTGKGRIVGEDIRRVNGSDILYIKWLEDLGNSKIIWLSYYLSNKTGHMRLAGGTTEELLAEYETDIIDLLNGLVDSNIDGFVKNHN